MGEKNRYYHCKRGFFFYLCVATKLKTQVVLLAISFREWVIFVEKGRDCGGIWQQKSYVKITTMAFLWLL